MHICISRSIHAVHNACFSWLSNILFYVYTTFSLSIPLLMDISVASMSWEL